MKLRQLALLVLPEEGGDPSLCDALRSGGLDVLEVPRAEIALDAVRTSPPDVVLVDARLGRVADALSHELPEGTRLLRLLPTRDAHGAAAWVLEPDLGLSPPLDARAVARRVLAVARPRGTRLEPSVLEQGPVRVDVAAHRAFVHGREVALTSLEFRLLATLLTAQGRVLSREQLLRDVWGVHARSATRTIDTHLKRLRGKLGDARDVIETVRNAGWRVQAVLAAPQVPAVLRMPQARPRTSGMR